MNKSLIKFVTDFGPLLVFFSFYYVNDNAERVEAVLRLLLEHRPDSAVVFCNTRRDTEEVAARLREANLKVIALHGELDQRARDQALVCFANKSVSVLVATDVAARGIHVDGLDLVINFDMPRSGDEYVHRIGRTGRVGGEGTAISLIAAHEWNLMAGIQRYLRQNFEYRLIEALKGNFLGPKNLKSNGKAAGSKKKKRKKKADAKKGKKPARKKAVAKKNSRTNKPVPDTNSGFATVKKRKNPGPLD